MLLLYYYVEIDFNVENLFRLFVEFGCLVWVYDVYIICCQIVVLQQFDVVCFV